STNPRTSMLLGSKNRVGSSGSPIPWVAVPNTGAGTQAINTSLISSGYIIRQGVNVQGYSSSSYVYTHASLDGSVQSFTLTPANWSTAACWVYDDRFDANSGAGGNVVVGEEWPFTNRFAMTNGLLRVQTGDNPYAFQIQQASSSSPGNWGSVKM